MVEVEILGHKTIFDKARKEKPLALTSSHKLIIIEPGPLLSDFFSPITNNAHVNPLRHECVRIGPGQLITT